jgi:hypothetical protein
MNTCEHILIMSKFDFKFRPTVQLTETQEPEPEIKMSIEKENDNKNLITEISSKSTVHTPEYTIIHSGDFDFSDYTLARVRTKPTSLLLIYKH